MLNNFAKRYIAKTESEKIYLVYLYTTIPQLTEGNN